MYKKTKIVVLSSVIGLYSIAWAQANEMRVWEQISRSDAALRSCNVKWNVCKYVAGKKDINIEREVAKTVELARQQGQEEEQIEVLAKWARGLASKQKSPSLQYGTMNFLYNGTATLADVQWKDIDKSVVSPSIGRTLDYFDGKNAITVQGANANMPKNGVIKRDGYPGLRYSATSFGFSQILAGHPLSEIFSVQNSKVKDNGDSIILERTLKAPKDTTPRDDGGLEGLIIRAKIAKSNWRLVSLDYWSPFSKRVLFRTTIGSYRFESGVWFPAKVTNVTFPDVTAEFKTHETYELTDAAFNENANVKALEKPLPIGASMNDFRFGDESGVAYVIRKGGVPGDESVRRLLDKRKAGEAEDARLESFTTVRNIAIPLGSLLIVVGLFWYRRVRRV